VGLPMYWVNTATLGLVIEDTDFSWDGLGPKIALKRTYNPDTGHAGMFGRSWNFSYESSIIDQNSQVYIRQGTGQTLLFTLNAGVYTPPSGNNDTLVKNPDHWLLTQKDKKLVHRYETVSTVSGPRVLLKSIADRNGNSVAIAYNGSGDIASVTDAAGRSTT